MSCLANRCRSSVAAWGPLVAPQDPLYQDLFRIAESPSRDFWFGTDELGRDLFSRILVGARTALIIATLVTFISAGLGTLIGLVSAYLGGWVDGALMRLADVLLAFPTFLLAAFLNATLRPPVQRRMEGLSETTGLEFVGSREVVDFIVVFGALAVVSWSGYARLIRSQVLSLRQREFVEAARSLGAPTRTRLAPPPASRWAGRRRSGTPSAFGRSWTATCWRSRRSGRPRGRPMPCSGPRPRSSGGPRRPRWPT